MATQVEIAPELLTTYQNQLKDLYPISPQKPRDYPKGYVKAAIATALGIFNTLNRDTLVKITQIPRTTLYDTLVKLILDGDVKKVLGPFTRLRGRPTVLFQWVAPSN
jgi:hypothetical protein